MDSIGAVPGAARLHLVEGVPLLRPEDQVFSAMLAGFADQQLARNLGPGERGAGVRDVCERVPVAVVAGDDR